MSGPILDASRPAHLRSFLAAVREQVMAGDLSKTRGRDSGELGDLTESRAELAERAAR